MLLGISLHLGMTTQTAVSIFDQDLYFMGCDIAFGGIHVVCIKHACLANMVFAL